MFHNFAPEHAGGADFGYFHEVVASGSEVEDEVFGDVFDGEAAVGEVSQEVVGGGYGEAEFLNDAGACVMEVAAVY